MSAIAFLWAVVVAAPPQALPTPTPVRPAFATQPVTHDPDDPAIWVHPTRPELSLILGTDKEEVVGGLFVFDLNGRILQHIPNLNYPNNVDIVEGFLLGGKRVDLAVLTERESSRLRAFAIDPATRKLRDVSGDLDVFVGQPEGHSKPMGIALYKRPQDGAVFAILSRKSGPINGYLWQYRLEDDGTGRVRARKVREFGQFSGQKEVEAIAVDAERNAVYYSDELFGVRKYAANPDTPGANRELALFALDGYPRDREGIAIYKRNDGTGYILVSNQIPNASRINVYRREGTRQDPHDHRETVKVVATGADSTDGIEVTSRNLGPRFPNGIVVVMNSKDRNFLVYKWEDFALAGSEKLKVGR